MRKECKFFDKVMEALFPSKLYCIYCGSLIDKTRNYAICDNCIHNIHWAESRTCAKCGKILHYTNCHDLCYDCRRMERNFDKGYTCALYDEYTRSILSDFKFNSKDYLGIVIGDVLADRMRMEDEAIDIVTSVPIHSSRMVSRGYNQAEIMARRFTRLLKTSGKNTEDVCKTDIADVNVCGLQGNSQYRELLKRCRKTAAMKALDVAERRSNVENAFELKAENRSRIAGKNIAIVDDIFTTGSTLDECSRLLKAGGAARVIVITFAAGADAAAAEEVASAESRC